MTVDELRTECERAKADGLTYVLINVAIRSRDRSRFSRPGVRKRILTGVYGRVVAPAEGDTVGVVCEVKADDVLRRLAFEAKRGGA